jgi:hypothetical protein
LDRYSKRTLGKNTASYHTTSVHIGSRSHERLKRMRYNPNIDYDEKILASSEKDYQSHEKIKNLMLRSGFYEKGFSFLMEDTFLTVNDYIKLYNQKEKIRDTLTNTKTKTDLYGCIYKTKNQFKIINKLDFYDVSIRLHLVKLTDQNKNVRDLINNITNNKSNLKKEPSKVIKPIGSNGIPAKPNTNTNTKFDPQKVFEKVMESVEETDKFLKNDRRNPIK